MGEHPAPFLLNRFIAGKLSARESSTVLRHLLSGCESCLAVLGPFVEALPQAVEPEVDDYELPLRRAFEAVGRHGTKAPAVKAATRKLHGQMSSKKLESVSLKGYPDHAIFEALLQRMQDLRHDDPKAMVLCGRLAVQTASTMVKSCSSEVYADYQTRALAELANALRVSDDLNEARKHLDQAEQWYAAGTHCDVLWLRLQDIRASLYGAQQHYQDAIGLLEEVSQGRLKLGDRAGAARALIGIGIFTAYVGQPGEAFCSFDQALGLLKFSSAEELVALACHNRLLVTVDMGQFHEAFEYLEQNRSQLMRCGGKLDRVKLVGIEGRIWAGLGHFDLAEQAFHATKQGFAEAGVRGHEALITLDLASVILGQGRNRYSEAVSLAIEALKTFTQLQVKPQVIEALNVLVHAIQDGLVTPVLLQSVADFMRKAEHDRRARYQARFE